MDSEEEALYNGMHDEEDEVTSGYSTISSSMEEAFRGRQMVNHQSTVNGAMTVAKFNNQAVNGLISSHGPKKAAMEELSSAPKETQGGKSSTRKTEGTTKKTQGNS